MKGNNDSLTDEQFWSENWNQQRHKVRNLRFAYVANRQLARLFARALASLTRPKLIEIGCADSLWLPFLAQNYEIEGYGIDYSEIGCQLAKRNLAIKNVDATIICQDVLEFAKEYHAAFDFVYSMGLIEHFADPTAILKEMYSLLKPGGKMLTTIPNLHGIYTQIAKIASPKILAKHKANRPTDLAHDLQAVGFQAVEVGYTGGALKLSVVNYSPWTAIIGNVGYGILCKWVNLTDIVVGNILAAIRIPNQQLTSPYICAICQKPLHSG